MIRLLIPLGLLALLSIVALILIYVIRPNYQVKHISSTYMWQQALKYRKKRVTASTIRNVLLFISQLLILTGITLVIAKPAVFYGQEEPHSEIIAIIDASASMNAGSGKNTRFQRAIEGVRTLSDSILSSGGEMSIILADDTPEYLIQRVNLNNRFFLADALEQLEEAGTCYNGSADLDEAIALCEDVLTEDPSAKIYLYTDTIYQYVPDGIEVVSVSAEGEWNAAFLSASAVLEDGFYTVYADVACYGREMSFDVKMRVIGANANTSNRGETYEFTKTVYCTNDITQRVIFRYGGGEDGGNVFYGDTGIEKRFTSYDTIQLTFDINEQDSLSEDDYYFIYGGRKEILKVLYCSTDPNPFFTGGIDGLKSTFSEIYDIRFTEVRKERGSEFITQDYDFYIYEHEVPLQLPTDGVVLLADPDKAPTDSGFRIVTPVQLRDSSYMLLGEEHPVVNNFIADIISLHQYTRVECEPEFKVLLTCDSDPVLFLRNDGANQIVVMPFSVHESNLVRQPEWMILLYNLFKFYLPATIEGNSFEINESVTLQSRGPQLTVVGEGYNRTLTEFPASISFTKPGTYSLKRTSYFGDDLEDVNIFVKIPAIESNLWRQEDSPARPYVAETTESFYQDLVVWLAAAIAALLLLEWWLQARGNR